MSRIRSLRVLARAKRNKVSVRGRRKPPEGGLPALVEPPRDPSPLAGGAAAPLEFDA